MYTCTYIHVPTLYIHCTHIQYKHRYLWYKYSSTMYMYIITCRRTEERSKQGHTNNKCNNVHIQTCTHDVSDLFECEEGLGSRHEAGTEGNAGSCLQLVSRQHPHLLVHVHVGRCSEHMDFFVHQFRVASISIRMCRIHCIPADLIHIYRGYSRSKLLVAILATALKKL